MIKSHILKVLIYSLCCAVCVLGFGCQKVLQEPVFYLLGERHGVPSQQLEISQWLAELSETDSKTVVVMEMISVDQAELVKAFKHLQPDDPKDFGYAIGWNKTSWPDYKFYAPIIKVIWENDMHLAAGDVSKLDRQRWQP